MNYDLVYTTRGWDTLDQLEPSAQQQVRNKLKRIASSEFREPWEWDFCRMDGCADGRFKVSDGIRVFADIDLGAGVIRVHHVGHRENLYA